MSLRLRLVECTTAQYEYEHGTTVESFSNVPPKTGNLSHWCISTVLHHSTSTRSISVIRKLVIYVCFQSDSG